MFHAVSTHPWLYIGVGVCVVLLLIKMLSARGINRNFPYTLNEALFTQGERAFLAVLDQALGEEYRIFGKVRIADVASVKSIRDQRSWYRAFNKISAKHFDYVLCDRKDLSFVAVVELDDRSHERPERQERDAFVAGVCQAIGLPLIQVPAQGAYSVDEVRSEILEALRKGNRGVPRRRAPAKQSSKPAQTSEASAPVCPKCGSPMILRKAKQGANAGSYFWGCSAFPDCRHIMRVEEHA
jgi:predicted RNA-binding Zn-ribbon protein involved in translation (DUF1610 family)